MDFLKRAWFAFVLLVIGVIAASACGFEPNFKDGGYSCATDRSCPNGYQCAADNKCYRPGAGPAPIATADGGGDSGPSGPSPLILMADVSGLEGNADNAPDLVFTAKLVPASNQEVRVDWATVEDAAKNVDDFTPANGTIVFPPGTTSQTIHVKVKGDRISEPNELFYVALTNPVNGRIDPEIPNAKVRATILNDDTPGLVVDDITVTEGDTGTTTASVTVTLTGAFPNEVTVNYATEDDTAKSVADYEATTGSLAFAPGETTKIVDVPIVNDAIFEESEIFNFNLSNAIGAPLLDGQARITVKDNEALPTITIADAAVDEGNEGTATLSFTVKASGESAKTMKVAFATADGTAKTALSDYSAASGTVTFEPGQTEQTISVTVNGDALFEDAETMTVTLNAPVGAALGTKVTGTGTISNDDAPPIVTIESVALNEGMAAAMTTFPFTVRLSTASSKPVTVSYATSDGTATVADNDYTAATGMLTIPAGQTTGVVNVTVKGDAADEGVQAFNVTISAPTNATLGATTVGIGTILNDDSVDPKITIDDVTVSESAGTMTFTLTLEKTVSQQVTVDFATGPAPSGEAATENVDYTAKNGTVTWPSFDAVLTKTVTIDITNDDIYEASEVFAVNLTNAVGGNIFDAQGIGTITNDETPPVISIAPITSDEGDVGTKSFDFVVTLSRAASTNVTVSYATAAVTATAGVDYQNASGVLTFLPGEVSKQIGVTVNGDIIDEDNETFTVTLSGPSANATLGTATATGTITDDDATPTLTIGNVTQAEGSNGTSSFVFTVTLSGPSSKTVTVDYATANGTALAGSDFSTAMGTLSFAPDSPLTRTITVTVTADTVNEPNEAFTVNLSNPTNATIADGTGDGSITNDDTPLPTLSIDNASANEGASMNFTVTLSGIVNGTVTVNWQLFDITTSSTDRGTSPLSGTLTFDAANKTRTITIAASNDSFDEDPETFEIRLSGNSANSEIFDGIGVGTVNDTDSTPTLSFADLTREVDEGDNGSTTMTFTVNLSAISGRQVTVAYATSGGTASGSGSGKDYNAISGTLVFAPGETSKTINVTVFGDTSPEGDEYFYLGLSNPVNANLPGSPNPYRATGTIRQ